MTGEDVATLLPGEYVNDSILDAFIKHVWSRPETSDHQVRQHGSCTQRELAASTTRTSC